MKRQTKQFDREIDQFRRSQKDNISLAIFFLMLILINLFTPLGGNKISVATIHLVSISLLIGNFYRAHKDSKEIKALKIRILELNNNS
jgi:hypothetical protein